MDHALDSIRSEFPILSRTLAGRLLAYLDNAATTQKPISVTQTMIEHLALHNANINRGVHFLGEEATLAYDQARKTVQQFIHAHHTHEIIFTRNATESINIVAKSWGETFLQPGDSVVLSVMEHHSNIVPWLCLKEKIGIHLKWIDVDSAGNLDLDAYAEALSDQSVKLVAMTGLSNVLGSMTPLKKIIAKAHAAGALVLVDASQLIVHEPIDVLDLGCDFLAFTGHKLYGPTGIGVLYGRTSLLEKMPPFLGGGDMIQSVTRDHFTVAELPRKFEAGTPAITEAIGLRAAIQWIEKTGLDAIAKHEQSLLVHAQKRLSEIDGLTIFGPKNSVQRRGLISFTIDGTHPHDITQILSDKGICLRAGHHCTQPLHEHLGITATTRLSVAAYNTMEEIDVCVDAMVEAQTRLAA